METMSVTRIADTVCETTVANFETAIAGVVAWATLNEGYGRIGGVEAVMSVMDEVRNWENGNANLQSATLTNFALSLLEGNCKPVTYDGCECCCTATEESDTLLVSASRVLATHLSTPLKPEALFYPVVRLPENAEYLPGMDRFSKSVCEEVYIVTQKATDTGALKAPEGMTLLTGVLNAGVAKAGFAKTLAAASAEVRSGSQHPPGSIQFDVDIGDENNVRACASWTEGSAAWSTDTCTEIQKVETIVTCECSVIAASYGLLITDQRSFPAFVTAGAAIVVVAAAILFFCCFVIDSLNDSMVGTIMKHVAIATLLLHIVFLFNILLTKSLDTNGQFVLGLLLHYSVLTYGLALTAASHFLYNRFKSELTAKKKGAVNKIVLRAIWIVPVAVVLVSILFGLENYESKIASVYGDTFGDDKISFLPERGLFFLAFFAEFMVLLLATLIYALLSFFSDRKPDMNLTKNQFKKAGKDDAGLSTSEIRSTNGLLLLSWMAPLLTVIAVSTSTSDLEYVVAICSVIQGISILVYCFVMADPGDELVEAIELESVADSSMVLNNVSSATEFQSMHGPTRSAAWTSFDTSAGNEGEQGQYQTRVDLSGTSVTDVYTSHVNGASSTDNAFSPALVDTAEFDDLIFSLKANPTSQSFTPHAASPPGAIMELSGLGASYAPGDTSNNRLSIADTHL